MKNLLGYFCDLSLDLLFESQGMSLDAINQAMDYMITTKSVMLDTIKLMLILGITFCICSIYYLVSTKPSRVGSSFI